MSSKLFTGAASRFVIASATARRAEAGPLSVATGVRSPMLMASPKWVSSDAVVTATSATGTCHGPTIWSRATVPVTERSPMVIKKLLLPTAGKVRTRSSASAMGTSPVNSSAGGATRLAVRCIFGGLPKSNDRGRSTGLLSNRVSPRRRCCSSVASPTTAKGQRSRRQMASNVGRSSGFTAIT